MGNPQCITVYEHGVYVGVMKYPDTGIRKKNLSDFGIRIVNLPTDANSNPLHHSRPMLPLYWAPQRCRFIYVSENLFCITS